MSVIDKKPISFIQYNILVFSLTFVPLVKDLLNKIQGRDTEFPKIKLLLMSPHKELRVKLHVSEADRDGGAAVVGASRMPYMH